MNFKFCLLWTLILLCIVAGCSSKPTKRSVADIVKERAALPDLFLTEKTHKEVLAPMEAAHSLAVYDASTGEAAWPAYYCTNPNCPAKDKGQNGHPFLFCFPDVTKKILPNGDYELIRANPGESRAQQLARLGGTDEHNCPECLKIRNLKTETPAQRQQYWSWVQEYKLPESVQRRKELDKEEADLIKERQERKVTEGQ